MRYIVFLLQCGIIVLVGGFLNEAHWQETGKMLAGPALMLGFGAAYVLTVMTFEFIDLFKALFRFLTRKRPAPASRRRQLATSGQERAPKVTGTPTKLLR